jgi:putative Holliday junction resolvase
VTGRSQTSPSGSSGQQLDGAGTGSRAAHRREPGRALGLDLGSRRIGVAVCDAGRTLATPLTVVDRVSDRSVEHAAIGELAAEHDAVVLVVGMPFSLDGGQGPTARAVASEVKSLRKRLGLEVVTHDERLSTVEAGHKLRGHGLSNRRSRQVIDQVAAAVILQSWIDAGAPNGADGDSVVSPE